MTEAVAAENAAEKAPIETLTVTGLRNLCRQLGVTGYSAMKKEEIIAAIQTKQVNVVEVRAPVRVQVPVILQEEKPAASWEDSFITELRNVCSNLEELPETQFLPEELLQLVTQIKNAEKVDELERFTEEELVAFIHTIKNQLPRYQREVFEVVNLISNASPMTVDVDFV